MATGVDDGVEVLLKSGSVLVHNLKPHLEAVLGCLACDGVVGGAVFAFFIAGGTPTLFSEMNVRSARAQSSEASCASCDSTNSRFESSSCCCRVRTCLRRASTSASFAGGSNCGAAPRPNRRDMRFVERSTGVGSGSSGMRGDLGEGGGQVEGSPRDPLSMKPVSDTDDILR